MATLFEITDEIRRLDELFDEFGNLDAARAQEIEALLTANEEAFASKADNYCALIREYQATAEARKIEAQRLAGLAKTDENKAAALKDRLELAMNALGVRKMKTARYALDIQQHGGKAPLIIEAKPENLPDRFRLLTVEADKYAIRAALESGEQVDGCTIGERGESLRIR